ncbi:MAG: bifunctional hydroxymethylpyrimidine kinase/phosphomethylpyrimidine kinase [Clostridia bacterium]
MSSAPPPIVLTFAASDPTGGAGLQADVLTLAGMGCHPLSVVTALTVQDTSGVAEVHPVDTRLVLAQAQRLLAESQVRAFKLGVLGSPANAQAVAGLLARHPGVPVVVDPVLASGRGDALSSGDMVPALREHVLPQATVATPNGDEARRLTGQDDLARCAAALADMGCEYVLVTGGHEAGDEVVNVLYDSGGAVREDRWPRLPGEYHGSGCTLASALAGALASGMQVAEAAHEAQEYTWQSLRAAFLSGRGQRTPDRFFWAGGERA